MYRRKFVLSIQRLTVIVQSDNHNLIMYNREYTPNRIKELQPNEVFVFGSDLEGMHGGRCSMDSLQEIRSNLGTR